VRVECAVLCDAATVREGLLHILGAGVIETTTGELPIHLPITFAFRAVLESREQKAEHILRIRLTEVTGELVSELEVPFRRLVDHDPFEETALNAPVSLSGMEVHRAGRYLIEATFDQRSIATFPLRVTREEASTAG
jgi:hypothetical protein